MPIVLKCQTPTLVIPPLPENGMSYQPSEASKNGSFLKSGQSTTSTETLSKFLTRPF